MYKPILAAALLAGCTAGFNDGQLAGFSLADPGALTFDRERQAQVELFVKTNHPALMADIRTGGGSTLTQAFALAEVPLAERPARLIQLNADAALYQNAPGTLVTALMLYGS